jgi:PAS domain S-box-containing protein
LGEEGVELGTDYRGVRVLAATRVVPGSPWGLVARIDVAEAYAPLRERLWLTVLLMGGLVLTVGAGVGAVWRRELTKLERARRVAEAERDWLRDVIERSLNEIFVVDPDSLRFLFVNRGAVRNLGYSEEELHGLTPLDIAPELTEASLRERLRTASSRRGQVHRFETTHRRKDGTDYPVEVHLQFVGTALGDFFLAVIDDITERHLAEARIRHLNRVYSVLSEVNQAIVRIRDPLALCREACRIAVEEGGFCEAQLSLRVAGSESLRLVAKVPAGTETSGERASGTEASPCPGLALEALRTGRHVVSDLPVEERLPSAPDDSLAASGTRSAAALPLVVEGEPAGALVLLAGEAGFFDEAELHLLDEMAMDIGFALETGRREAARREAEASLARSEKRFRAVARLSADFSYSCVRSGARGLIVDWITDAFFSISGYTEAELGETGCWMSFVHPEDREAAMEPLGRLKAGEADSREFRIVTRDGSVRWLLNRMECEEDASAPGGLRIFGAVQDVSRSRQAELAIRQLNSDLESRVAERTSDLAAANKELETFAYSVAHDLRAPLRAIDGYSQILLEEHSVVLNDQGRGYLGKVRRSAQRMAQLVDALLSYSRIERRSLQTESVDVVDVVRSVLGEMQEEIQGQRAELAVDMDRLVVRADREGLAVVLRNLVSNALKYSRGALPPRIEVGGRTEDGMIRFWVRDNGIGFDMTYHDRIFEIFQRLHHVEDFAGTGIGLALVKKAVDRMKGRVWAESAPGRGATFFVELPG